MGRVALRPDPACPERRPPLSGRPPERGGRLPPLHRWEESTLVIPATAVSIFVFESFVEGLSFLDRAERDRLKLAGGEIFDNLVRHAGPLEGGRMAVRAARRLSGPLLSFYFKAPGFELYVSRCGDADRWGAGAEEPRFDPATRRWRGIGSRMCRNLSRSITLRSGSQVDRIFIRF